MSWSTEHWEAASRWLGGLDFAQLLTRDSVALWLTDLTLMAIAYWTGRWRAEAALEGRRLAYQLSLREHSSELRALRARMDSMARSLRRRVPEESKRRERGHPSPQVHARPRATTSGSRVDETATATQETESVGQET